VYTPLVEIAPPVALQPTLGVERLESAWRAVAEKVTLPSVGTVADGGLTISCTMGEG
jgi:hypothetical protein